MTSVGVHELRQQASQLLRRVAQGETVEITDRGHPVAILAPVPDSGPLDDLRMRGEIEPATAALGDLPEPIELPPGVESPSEALARLRRDER